jgi:hypothetical protein
MPVKSHAERTIEKVTSLLEETDKGVLRRSDRAVDKLMALLVQANVISSDELGACTLPDLVTCRQTTRTYCEGTLGGSWAPGPCPMPVGKANAESNRNGRRLQQSKKSIRVDKAASVRRRPK